MRWEVVVRQERDGREMGSGRVMRETKRKSGTHVAGALDVPDVAAESVADPEEAGVIADEAGAEPDAVFDPEPEPEEVTEAEAAPEVAEAAPVPVRLGVLVRVTPCVGEKNARQSVGDPGDTRSAKREKRAKGVESETRRVQRGEARHTRVEPRRDARALRAYERDGVDFRNVRNSARTNWRQIAWESCSAERASAESHALTMHWVVAWTYCALVQRHWLSVAPQPKVLSGVSTQGAAHAARQGVRDCRANTLVV
ncbi:hypothetical protein EIP86_009367 [Pleurotus ostreatoroseus]|nr:hypothetical protein EIP86_009367 [Pleurotus ostreatoroseus]